VGPLSPRRSAAVQQGPPPDLQAFPRTPAPRSDLFREHAARSGCWFFHGTAEDHEPEGRFDLPLPRGTCYAADTAATAARERCGPLLAARQLVPAGHVAGRVVTRFRRQAGWRALADLLSDDAVTFGVTGELSAGNDYALSAEWAVAFDAAGRGGIRYRPRFTPGRGVAYALFSDVGPRPDWPVLDSVPLARVLRDNGITVVEPPSSAMVAVDDTAAPDASG
jgi:hypothetical protein